MKTQLLLLTILLSAFNAFSQSDFVPGYIIQSNGDKVNCLIKNEDWKGTPTIFYYKLSENDEAKIGTVSSIKEFGSFDTFKYIVATISMEQSDDKVEFLKEDRNPDFKEETIFLKTLIEGDASLYFNIKNGGNRFFYKMKDGEIQPLIYKRFLTKSKKIGKNNRFKQQLATDLVCSNSKSIDFNKSEYKRSSLIKRFEEYNTCTNADYIVFRRKQSESKFNLTIRPGITSGSASIRKQGVELGFDSKGGYRIGLEAEYILPFHNGKWGMFVEAAYRNYTAEKDKSINEAFPTLRNTTTVTVVYNSIELPLGVRYYMFLNKDSAVFINGAYVIDISVLDSSITSSKESSYNLDFKSEGGFAIGAGFKFKNKYSIEARYLSPKNIINYTNVTADYESFSLIAGYNFL